MSSGIKNSSYNFGNIIYFFAICAIIRFVLSSLVAVTIISARSILASKRVYFSISSASIVKPLKISLNF
nr:hypothetical protein [uncultured Fusobacterium sp.]